MPTLEDLQFRSIASSLVLPNSDKVIWKKVDEQTALHVEGESSKVDQWTAAAAAEYVRGTTG